MAKVVIALVFSDGRPSDINSEIKTLFTRTNILCRRFKRCSLAVKVRLLRTFCVCFYNAALRLNSTTRARPDPTGPESATAKLVVCVHGHQNVLTWPDTAKPQATSIRLPSWQEAQLSPRDRARRRVNWNLASCHATVQKLLIRQVLTKSMVWSWRFHRRQCVIDNVHSTMTRPSRLPLSQVS